MDRHRSLGVVTGAAQFACADVLGRLTTAYREQGFRCPFDLVFEPRAWQGSSLQSAASTRFKLHVFDTMRAFEKRGIDGIVLPCFLSHTFIDELTANVSVPVANIMSALVAHVRQAWPSVQRIGVLTSGAIRENGLFERYFDADRYQILYPRNQSGVDCVTSAVYSKNGIGNGRLDGRPVELLRAASEDLIAQGAEIILPGLTEVSLVWRALGPLPVPVVDSNLVYARYVAAAPFAQRERHFKVGVVGGVGPAATVDFMSKLVRNTPASRDQEHIRIMVEQNPQIPDRTQALLAGGEDPTLALYAACRTLEEGGADIIAIPCNTAHAFVEQIQPSLSIPIVNMLTCTADHLRKAFPTLRDVGVLATSGTLASGVYRTALEARDFAQIAPHPDAQARLMNAIYGPRGAKAGFTRGECVDDLAAAVDDLVSQGARVIVLGCTELPLLLRDAALLHRHGAALHWIDPGDVLAKRCVAYALGRHDLLDADPIPILASTDPLPSGAERAYG